MKYNYLVVGSTGLVGSNLIKFLSNLGLKTIALTRRKISNLPANVDELLIDFNHSLENISILFLFKLYVVKLNILSG